MNRQPVEFVPILSVAILIGFATSLPAAEIVSTPNTINPDAVQRCNALAQRDFSQIAEAPTQILRTKIVETTGPVPGFCEIDGVIMPNVGFRLKLPTDKWNGRFFEAGCGNYCGTIDTRGACNDVLRKGYACIATDSGHLSRPEDVAGTDGQWAYNNVAAALDYGGRASHVAAVAGKAITSAFYKKAPVKSYFMGCSYGGHQAMALAQRYPWDFDGIVGGGAPNSISGLMQQNAWAMTVAYDPKLQPLFSEADVRVLHEAALARCDMDDGVKDGIISNPGSCVVNVDALVCKPGIKADCLSPEIATAAKKMYVGPSTSSGARIAPGGWAPGSEMFWRHVYRPDGVGLAALAPNYFRYMGRLPAIGPSWSVKDYDFDSDYKRNDDMETLYAAANPDLRRFKAAGGKFINYAGWSDLGTVPNGAIDYYQTVEKTMGGKGATESFFRLFVIPAALHCRGGDGPSSVDFLSYIEAWVENNQAPDVVIGAHPTESGGTSFTRPIYPYPTQVKYKGSGDVNDAANFRPENAR